MSRYGVLVGMWLVCVAAYAHETDAVITVLEQRLDSSAHIVASRMEGIASVRLAIGAQYPDADWLRTPYVRVLSEAGITLDDASPNVLTLVPRDVATRYRNMESADSVYRDIATSVDAMLQQGTVTRTIDASLPMRTDHCLRTDALAAQSMQHMATHGVLPVPSATIWDDLLQPIVYVSAAVATIVLLFTVRSN